MTEQELKVAFDIAIAPHLNPIVDTVTKESLITQCWVGFLSELKHHNWKTPQ